MPDLQEQPNPQPPGRLAATTTLEGTTLALPSSLAGMRVLFWGVFLIFTLPPVFLSSSPFWSTLALCAISGFVLERLLLWIARGISQRDGRYWLLFSIGLISLPVPLVLALGLPFLAASLLTFVLPGLGLMWWLAGHEARLRVSPRALHITRGREQTTLPLEELQGVQLHGGHALYVLHQGRSHLVQRGLTVEEGRWTQELLQQAIARRSRALADEGHDLTKPAQIPQQLAQAQRTLLK